MTRFSALSDALGRFARDETGAVTVDWVVASAAAVGFGFAAADLVEQGAVRLANSISGELAAITVDAGDGT